MNQFWRLKRRSQQLQKSDLVVTSITVKFSSKGQKLTKKYINKVSFVEFELLSQFWWNLVPWMTASKASSMFVTNQSISGQDKTGQKCRLQTTKLILLSKEFRLIHSCTGNIAAYDRCKTAKISCYVLELMFITVKLQIGLSAWDRAELTYDSHLDAVLESW